MPVKQIASHACTVSVDKILHLSVFFQEAFAEITKKVTPGRKIQL